MKHFVKICVVLTLVCTLMTALLAVVNSVTDPLIRENEAKKRVEILSDFFPEMSEDYVSHTSDVSGVSLVYEIKDGDGALLGYCVEVVKTGYAGDVSMMVALDAQQVLCGVSLVSHSETKGITEKKEADALCDSFIGQKGKQKFTESGGVVEKIAGATYSSRAVLDGVNAAVQAVALVKGGASS